MTYAASGTALAAVEGNPRYAFARADIRDAEALAAVFDRHRPDAVMHLAAESHSHRSIADPAGFIHTNVVGTFNLLKSARVLGGLFRRRLRSVLLPPPLVPLPVVCSHG